MTNFKLLTDIIIPSASFKSFSSLFVSTFNFSSTSGFVILSIGLTFTGTVDVLGG